MSKKKSVTKLVLVTVFDAQGGEQAKMTTRPCWADMPHLSGCFDCFATWAGALMKLIGEDIRFAAPKSNPHTLMVFDDTYTHGDWYEFEECEDGSIDVR